MIERSTMEMLDCIGDVVYRTAVAFNIGCVVGSLLLGDYRRVVAFTAMIGMLVCTVRLRDAGFVRIDRWRDRKIAEIEAKYHPEDDSDGR